jgi:hypothetical protein
MMLSFWALSRWSDWSGVSDGGVRTICGSAEADDVRERDSIGPATATAGDRTSTGGGDVTEGRAEDGSESPSVLACCVRASTGVVGGEASEPLTSEERSR